MKEIIRTNDVVKLSWLRVLLSDSGIESHILDTHTSIIEGSIGALPRRLVVDDEDYLRSRRILEGAGEQIGS